jgi:serine/threonine protein kinase
MTDRSVTGYWPAPVETISADWPTLPGYEILEELGRGGMGVVYKARQVSLKRLVALKLIRDGALAGPQERARFRIEAEVVARMQHANIVQIYEAGEHQGRLYFAMELIEGSGLDKRLAGQPQPAPQAAELVRTLALAVEHAHAQQVVHRDLKPANILLQKDEGGRMKDESRPDASSGSSLIPHPSSFVPKITDFGLAKRLDRESTAATQDGAVLGTASYMAPEQAAGRVREIGPGVDVYALGAILYEMLTGRPPFRAESWRETVEQVIHDEPTPPTRWRADVPRALETICLKCLEKAPDRRYASARELADDLDRFLEGIPVTAVPLADSERLARLAARDDYQIVEEIGHGPRSTVYRALYGPLKQPVAVKVFATGICSREEWEARVRRGTDLWAALAHPQIVPVQRAGWWDGVAYLALEYVPHGSLADKAAGQPGPIRQTLRLVEQLAEIVSYLHRQGVVHGNLKPSNVLFAADGIPRLVDFRPTGGLFLGPLPADHTSPAGLCYLAPELARDTSAKSQPYTDIYGLGMILYYLLTSRSPFASRSTEETLEEVRSQDPTPPSHLNPEVTPPLESFCLRCLRKNPWRRYYRVYDLLTRLRDFQDHLEGQGHAMPSAAKGQRRRPLY